MCPLLLLSTLKMFCSLVMLVEMCTIFGCVIYLGHNGMLAVFCCVFVIFMV